MNAQSNIGAQGQSLARANPFFSDHDGEMSGALTAVDPSTNRHGLSPVNPQGEAAVFSFALRGASLNPLIDAASPLLALLLRIFNLHQYEHLNILHKKCRHEIEAIEVELQRLGFDRVTVLALRYCLCSVIDEAVMATPWGQNSDWSSRSLLPLYHDETWGGEKYFVILERLMMEPAHYIQIIEFLYLCLCLGYEGKYRPMKNGRMQLETLIREVHKVIRKERGEGPELVTHIGDHIVEKADELHWQTPLVMVVGVAFLVCLVLYLGYFFYTDNFTSTIIMRLADVLNQQN